MSAFAPVTLSGELVTLEPLSMDHHEGLVEAVSDGELWNLWYTRIPRPERMAEEIERRLGMQRAGSMLPFTVRRTGTGEVLGMTTYCNINAETPKVEIGYTWNRASTQRTGTNAESKLLLLAHAFEALECTAVEFRTHWMNHQSREAIARLGAKQDGVLRGDVRMPDGTVRDTVVFSVIASEWPMVRSHLLYRLAKPRS